MKLIAGIIFALIVVSCSAEDQEEASWNPEIPDCTAEAAVTLCPQGSTYRAGNACTDHCLKELMDCHPRMTCGCYCINDLRKVDGKCVPKCKCPKFD